MGVTQVQLICAWIGCSAATSVADDLPPGWRFLLTTQEWLTGPAHQHRLERDAVLCPAHAAELEKLLKRI